VLKGIVHFVENANIDDRVNNNNGEEMETTMEKVELYQPHSLLYTTCPRSIKCFPRTHFSYRMRYFEFFFVTKRERKLSKIQYISKIFNLMSI